MRDRFEQFISVGDFIIDSASGNGWLCFGIVREVDSMYITYSPIKPNPQTRKAEVCMWTIRCNVSLTLTVLSIDLLEHYQGLVDATLGEL